MEMELESTLAHEIRSILWNPTHALAFAFAELFVIVVSCRASVLFILITFLTIALVVVIRFTTFLPNLLPCPFATNTGTLTAFKFQGARIISAAQLRNEYTDNSH